MRSIETVRSHLGLCKATLSMFAALSAATGFLLAGVSKGTVLPALIFGVFLMACGASALNQYQERKTDSGMPRTAGRPIPAGKIEPRAALRFSWALIGSGAVMLLFSFGWRAPMLGLACVLWYNGIYTRLKAHHAFAAIPGALVGAIPPAIGWTAGGGSLSDFRLAAICFFFFMWQVHHFLIHQKAFGSEYQAIHFPSLTAVFTPPQLERLTLQWLLGAAASLQLVILYGLIRSSLVQLLVLAASLGFAACEIAFIRREGSGDPGIFMSTNYFMLTVILLILADRLPCFAGWAG
ncbi:MAG: UbiA family prenyltransferase [Deltaproteobacteria bacterium]|nr:UbiA family prenyltransferase [Deltaproteobacteria bacterium]